MQFDERHRLRRVLHEHYVHRQAYARAWPDAGHGTSEPCIRDKPCGLVVDYIGILPNLKNALKDYSPSDQSKTGISEDNAAAPMLKAFERMKAVFHGHDHTAGLVGLP